MFGVNNLLGSDFLSRFDVSININQGYVTCKGQRTPFLKAHQVSANPSDILLTEDTIVPAQTQIILQGLLQVCSLDNSREQFIGRDSVFDSNRFLNDFIQIANTAVRPTENGIPINVANFSDEDIELQAGTILGTLHPCANEPTANFYLLEINDSDESNTTNTPPMPTNESNQMPPVDLSNSQLDPAQKQQVEALLIEYADIFATDDQPYGKTDLITHSIDTGDSLPVKKRAYRTSPKIRHEIEKKCSDLLQQDLIEISDSPWASPVILVKKKAMPNEAPSYRLVLDYRALNSCTVKDSHPVPSLEETIESLAGNNYFSVMDLSSGYHQIPMNPADSHKTAFTTGTDLYQWKRCPMGLCNAGQTFQRLIEMVFRGMRWKKVVCYLDDICCFGQTFDEKLANLREVFDRLRSAGLKLGPKKCKFFCTEVNFLGHVVSGEGISPDPQNIQKVADWPRPTNPTQVRGFCSLASYYRKFIKDFSKIAHPLNKLTQKDTPFVWSDDCEKAFLTLKQTLTSSPIVSHPDFSLPWLLYTDASNYSIGSVLAQKDQNGKEHVIAYFSASLSKTQQKIIPIQFWLNFWTNLKRCP